MDRPPPCRWHTDRGVYVHTCPQCRRDFPVAVVSSHPARVGFSAPADRR